ncbi:MAG: hypothetical protein JWP12_1855 [Bacteroidetes bacterium]|nr:hypothetical protein [Bacteroidota bacterium]
MKVKDSVKQLTKNAMAEVRVDIDIEYCKKYGIKYNNHEIDAATVDLFNTKSNKAAFDFLTKNR